MNPTIVLPDSAATAAGHTPAPSLGVTGLKPRGLHNSVAGMTVYDE
jgi:hypothetical protein